MQTVNELELDRTVAVSKHLEVGTSINSENAVQEEKELAERTEESSEVFVVEREGQEETTVTLERISQKENIEENVKATDDTKENEAENQEVIKYLNFYKLHVIGVRMYLRPNPNRLRFISEELKRISRMRWLGTVRMRWQGRV